MFLVSVVAGDGTGAVYHGASIDVAKSDDIKVYGDNARLQEALDNAKENGTNRICFIADENGDEKFISVADDTKIYVMNDEGTTVAQF
jgi:hypothetical protein